MYFHEYPKPAAVACYSLKGKQEMGRHEVNPFIYKNVYFIVQVQLYVLSIHIPGVYTLTHT